MKKIISKDIEKQSKELINKYHLYHNFLHLSSLRDKKRSSAAPSKKVGIPDEWAEDKKFNPFYVLKRRKQIAASVSKKILAGTYKPNKPFQKEIPKKGGGVRKINVFQIPDSAISDRFYSNLLSKNKHRFSSLTYAYRNDRNIHFAIQDISLEFSSTPRIYVAEFDFSNFFASINHEFIFRQLKQNSFLVSYTDLQIINSFLPEGGVGIPLGTSISLFLANVVCWKLDRDFENEGIRFARYADDTIIWSKEYSKITKAFDMMNSFSKESGIKINFKKSHGINLIQRKGLPSEFINSKEFIEFLGYKISTENTSIKDSSIKKIKKQISYILYKNLIQPIRFTHLHVRIPERGVDLDFITSIMQIRRYLYGNLNEITLRRYLNGTYKKLSFKGIMSFYPLINDSKQMIDMDKWLVSTIINTVQKRKKLFVSYVPKFDISQFPFGVNKNELLELCKNNIVLEKEGLIQIPSFVRIYNAVQIGIRNEGIEKIMNPKSSYYEE